MRQESQTREEEGEQGGERNVATKDVQKYKKKEHVLHSQCLTLKQYIAFRQHSITVCMCYTLILLFD